MKNIRNRVTLDLNNNNENNVNNIIVKKVNNIVT